MRLRNSIISIMSWKSSTRPLASLIRPLPNNTKTRLPNWCPNTNPPSPTSKKEITTKSTSKASHQKKPSKSSNVNTNSQSKVFANSMTKWNNNSPKKSMIKNLPPPINSPLNTKPWSMTLKSTTMSPSNKNSSNLIANPKLTKKNSPKPKNDVLTSKYKWIAKNYNYKSKSNPSLN